MTGLRTRLSTTFGRGCVGLVVAVASAVLLAPIASSTPESDADGAITAAWDAGGGPTGPLGIKDGGVYPAGPGFAQNFAAGKIFFTPDTGAHAMQGAILDKYLSLGGPADGDLGFPTIDEGDGRAPGSRNTTFSAADRPVIFWTPDTGARVVRGAINAAWDKVGGSAGVLGVPSDDETYRGDQTSQTFTGGQLTYDRKTKTFTTTPPELADQLTGLDVPGDVTTAIDAARRAAGGPLGPLGAADGSQYAIGADGAGQNFEGGKIYYSPATGANVLTGQVLAKYESVGGPEGDLGFPTSNENDGGIAPMSKIATFSAADQPAIFWTPDYGAVIVRGAMNAAWAKLGGATGELGAPTADQTESGDVVTQKFSGGAISWNKTSKQFTTEPAGLAGQLAGLQVPGLDAPQAPPGAEPADDGGSSGLRFSWWWLLGVVPVLILVGVVATAVLLNRRRHDDRAPLDDLDDDHYDDDDDDEDGDEDGDEDYDDPDGPDDSGALPIGGDDDDEHPRRRSGWASPAGGHAESGAEDGKSLAESFVADLREDQDAIDTAPTRILPQDDDASGKDDHYPWSPLRGVGRDSDGEAGGDSEDGSDVEAGDALSDDEPDDGPGEDAGRPEREPDLQPDGTPEEQEPASGPPSGRHAAITLDEPDVAETSIRLAAGDPFTAPPGYPIKADTKTGVYWLPGTGEYDRAKAEIWFASEEFALTNGFTRG